MLVATGACLIALVAALLATTPWQRDPRSGDDAAPRRRARGPAAVERRAERPREPRAQAGRFPRAVASPEPLVPPAPVPPPPDTRVVVPLGRCCSQARPTTRVDAIVVHVTEMADRPGTGDLLRLARFFGRSRLGSHVADDADGLSSRMVADDRMAYHATYWNPTTVAIEQMGFSSFGRANWLARRAQLDTSAGWIATWARRYRIPIRRCVVAGIRYNRRGRVVAGTIARRGVCSHAQLDPRNRDDPGRGYPWDFVLARARALAGRAG